MEQTRCEGPDLLVGKKIREYRILSKIGEGGMGAVYKAYHELLREPRALKVLRRDLLGDESFIARFRREAEILVRLKDPEHITRFFEFFQHGDGAFSSP